MQLTKPGPSLSGHDIVGFEQEIEVRLPEDYRRFLLDHNGGFPNPPVGYEFEGEVHEIGIFDSLLTSSDSGLRRAYVDFQRYQSGYLPIAGDYGERDICIKTQNANGIYVTEYQYDDHEIPVSVVVRSLAASFTEFIESLVVVPDSFCSIEKIGKEGTAVDLDNYLHRGNSLDAIGRNELTIVCEAIKHNNIPLLSACIERGANLSASIYTAVQGNRGHVIEMLLAAGADINERDGFGKRPLEFAVGPARKGIRQLLTQLGATQ